MKSAPSPSPFPSKSSRRICWTSVYIKPRSLPPRHRMNISFVPGIRALTWPVMSFTSPSMPKMRMEIATFWRSRSRESGTPLRLGRGGQLAASAPALPYLDERLLQLRVDQPVVWIADHALRVEPHLHALDLALQDLAQQDDSPVGRREPLDAAIGDRALRLPRHMVLRLDVEGHIEPGVGVELVGRLLVGVDEGNRRVPLLHDAAIRAGLEPDEEDLGVGVVDGNADLRGVALAQDVRKDNRVLVHVPVLISPLLD